MCVILAFLHIGRCIGIAPSVLALGWVCLMVVPDERFIATSGDG